MIAKLAFLTVQGQMHEIDETTTHQGKVHEPYANVHTKNIDVTNETISGNVAVMLTDDGLYTHSYAANRHGRVPYRDSVGNRVLVHLTVLLYRLGVGLTLN